MPRVVLSVLVLLLGCGPASPAGELRCTDDIECESGWCDRGIMGVGLCAEPGPESAECQRSEECRAGSCEADFRCAGGW